MADKKRNPADRYLSLRGGVYHLWNYRIPKALRDYPQFAGITYYSQSLKTDSLSRARLARDTILLRLNSVLLGDGFDVWKDTIEQQAKQFASENKHLRDEAEDARELFRSMATEQILDSAIKSSGYMPDDSGHPRTITPTQQIQLDVLAGRTPKKHSGLLHISKLAMAEKERLGLSTATSWKIRNAVTWLLSSIKQPDIQLADIKRTMIKTALANSDKKGNTKAGYLAGLRAVWSYAVDWELISDDIKNPTEGHKNSLADQQEHDPYTKDEIYQLYTAATGELKQLIHVAATTGARISEVYTAELELASEGFSQPTWGIMLDGGGKNKAATRVIPIHHSIDVDGYRPYAQKRESLRYQFGNLVKKELGIRMTARGIRPRRLTFHSFRTSIEVELRRVPNLDRMAVDSLTGRKQTQAMAGSAASYLASDYELSQLDKVVQSIVWNP